MERIELAAQADPGTLRRLEVLRRRVPALPPDVQGALEDILDDDVVTQDERVAFLHVLIGQPMHPIHKGILREAIEYWAQRDAGLISDTAPA